MGPWIMFMAIVATVLAVTTVTEATGMASRMVVMLTAVRGMTATLIAERGIVAVT